jgi:cytochrome c553
MKHAYALIALLAAASIAGCADISRSRDLANPKVSGVTLAQQVCSNCHGIDGVSVSPNFPNLAAQQPAYFIAQLKEFKSHDRQDPAGFEYMWGLSRSFSDEQITALAAYFAAQPAPHGKAGSDEGRLKAGDTIFHQGVPGKNIPPCMACHGSEGQGNEAFPRLAGQHGDYVVKQLIVFQRTNERPEGAIMKTVAHELTSDDIRNIAVYVESLGTR